MADKGFTEGTEVRCQMASILQLNGELFSSYKNHITLKGLVGFSPGGVVTFIQVLSPIEKLSEVVDF